MSQGRDEEDLAKQEDYTKTEREEYLETLLDLLTPQDVRLLVQAEDELSQTKVLVLHTYNKVLATCLFTRLDSFSLVNKKEPRY